MSQPVFKRAMGHLSAAVFENQTDRGRQPMRSISAARRYFDRQSQEWKSTVVSLNPADVPAVIRLLQSVEIYLIDSSTDFQPDETGEAIGG